MRQRLFLLLLPLSLRSPPCPAKKRAGGLASLIWSLYVTFPSSRSKSVALPPAPWCCWCCCCCCRLMFGADGVVGSVGGTAKTTRARILQMPRRLGDDSKTQRQKGDRTGTNRSGQLLTAMADKSPEKRVRLMRRHRTSDTLHPALGDTNSGTKSGRRRAKGGSIQA